MLQHTSDAIKIIFFTIFLLFFTLSFFHYYKKIPGFAHKPGQVRVQGLVIDVRGFGRTLEISFPWKCKLTEGSERCSKILPEFT